MSLKDEIEKLIQAERNRLAALDEKRTESKEHQRQRFQVLRALLEEVAEAMDTEYLDIMFIDKIAYIRVGIGAKAEGDADWQIEPNYKGDWEDGIYPLPGFRVLYSGNLYREKELIFQTEEEVIQYILPKITKTVVYFEHLEERTGKL